MTTGYSNYHVEVRNVKFIADDGRTCPRTAIVTFFIMKAKRLIQNYLGQLILIRFLILIKEGKDLILDNFYIHAFSISSYRRH